MRLTRLDKFAYCLYWITGHMCGVHPFDWRADWNFYLQCRERGMSSVEAFCWLPNK